MVPSPASSSSLRRILQRGATVASVVTGLATFAGGHDAHASGAVLPRESTGSSRPVEVDVQVAIAATPSGTTRWARVTAMSTQPVLWLVPVRPGARLDLTGDGFLDALNSATMPRILAPDGPVPPGCAATSAREEVHPFGLGRAATGETPRGAVVLDDEPMARAHVASLGYALPSRLAARVIDLYARGWKLVSLELPGGPTRTSSKTLRVADDGAAELPLALTGAGTGRTWVTAFVVGPGTASLPQLSNGELVTTWSAGSDYAARRSSALVSGRFLRETSGHALLLGGPEEKDERIRSVAEAFLDPTCAARVESVANERGTVATSCAAGALGAIPGGTGCVPTEGAVPASTFTCGGDDNLALALSGTVPSRATVTRLVGFVDAGALVPETPLSFGNDAASGPVKRASAWACTTTPVAPPARPDWGPTDYASVEATPADDGWRPTSGGCSGSATVVSYEEEPPPPTDDTCSGSAVGSSSSSSSSSGGWDYDDGEDTSEDDTSSEEETSDGWDTEDSDDGWDSDDSEDESWDAKRMNAKSLKAKVGKPQQLKPAAVKKPAKHSSSPLSRIALVAAALVLPLRRRLKARGRTEFRA